MSCKNGHFYPVDCGTERDCLACRRRKPSAASAGYALPVGIAPVVRQLEDLATWFHSDKESRHIVVTRSFSDPSMILKFIANELRKKNEIGDNDQRSAPCALE